MIWSLGKAMSWSRGGTEYFLGFSNVHLLSTLSAQKKSDPCKGEICFFRSWNTLPCAQNLKPKFEYQTPLVQNSPVGTSWLLPFGANLDLPWDWRFLESPIVDSSLLFPVGVYYASNFLWNYIYHQKENIAYVTLDPVVDYVYISDLILELRVVWKMLPN